MALLAYKARLAHKAYKVPRVTLAPRVRMDRWEQLEYRVSVVL